MKTIIYVDVLLIVNLLITYVLLMLTCAVLRTYVKKLRLFIGSVIGAIYSLIVLAPEIHFLLSVLLKFFMCTSIVCLTFSLRSIRKIVRFSISFFAVNISFSGLLLLLENLFQNSLVYVKNANIYIHVEFPFLLIGMCICYLLLKFIILFFQRMPSNEIYTVRIYIDGVYVETTAMFDSGNTLLDPFSGKPVCILNKDVLLPLMPKQVRFFVNGNTQLEESFEHGWESRVAVVYTRFAAGSALLPTIKPDRLEIIKGRQIINSNDCILALTDNTFEELHCRMLLHPSLLISGDIQEGLNENSNR